MIDNLKDGLEHAETLDEKDLGGMLRTSLFALISINLISVVAFLLVGDPNWERLYTISLEIVVFCAIMLVLLRYQNVRVVSVIFLAGCSILLIYGAIDGLGVAGTAYSGLIIVIVATALFINRRAAFFLAFLFALFGLAMVFGQARGALPNANKPLSPTITWLNLTVYFFLAAAMLNLVMKYVDMAFARARAELRERQRAEEQLRELNLALEERILARTAELTKSEERYRLISEVSSDYVFSTTVYPNGTTSDDWVAGAFAKITGYTREEFQQRGGWPRLLHPDFVEQDQRDFQKLLQNEKVTTETCIIRKDGQMRWVRVSTRPVWNLAENRLGHIYGAVQDITTEKEAAQQILQLNASLEQRVAQRTAELEEALREMESFSYTISHDLRAPLRAVDGFTHILLEQQETQLDKRTIGYLTRIHQNASEMETLIDGLLAFIRSGRIALHKEQIDTNLIARIELKKLLTRAEGEPETSLAELPPCHSDPEVLTTLYQCLLNNALKFTRGRAPAKIEIGYEQRQGQVIYYVRDNGAGFDMRYADKLFGVFQRLHHHDEFEGNGLSLAIARRLIERQGGRIWAEAGVDQGATFYFIPSEEKI